MKTPEELAAELAARKQDPKVKSAWIAGGRVRVILHKDPNAPAKVKPAPKSEAAAEATPATTPAPSSKGDDSSNETALIAAGVVVLVGLAVAVWRMTAPRS